MESNMLTELIAPHQNHYNLHIISCKLSIFQKIQLILCKNSVRTIMQTLEDIGAQLKLMRLKRNLTQSDIKAETGISQQHYQRAETGHDIRLSSLLKICEGMGLTVMLVPNRDTEDVYRMIDPENHKPYSLLDTMKDLED